MGPLSHVFVSTEVTKRKTPLLIFGSILPDISWISTIQLGKEKIHFAPKELYAFIQSNYPEMIDIGIGVRLHTSTERGADYYSDDRTEGFAYKEAPKITRDIADLLELTTKGVNIPWKYGIKINSNSFLGKWKNANKTIALIIAHNFIEAGVDLNLLRDKPSLVTLYQKSLACIDREKIYSLLAHYLQTEKSIVDHEVTKFLKAVDYSQDSIHVIAEKNVAPLLTTLFGREIDDNKIATILSKARNITKPKYMTWLRTATKHMTVDFHRLLTERNFQ